MVPVPAVADTAYGHIETNDATVVEAAPRKGSLESDVEKAVRSYFKDVPVLIQIARCESTFRHTLPDGSILRGKVDPADVGVMQINTRYHGAKAKSLGLDLTNLYDNMKFARDLYEEQGTKPWKASSACWSNSIAMR
ncbi:MAG TPA: hypothetical protein VFS75_03430 [Candidatus Paceibacterota bacterium]|nr:hypothetical protein [Candidatus Paceibacterota bacterium]